MGISTMHANAYKMANAYMCYAHTASDGTIFVPSPVADVASRNLVICRLSSDGSLVKVHDKILYANPSMASKAAKLLCDSYENALKQKEKEVK